MKTVKKIVIYYTDGTYQEVNNDNTYKPGAPYPNYPSPPLNPTYPYMPPTYPPGVPPTWTSPFTYTVPNHKTFGTANDIECGAGVMEGTNMNGGAGSTNWKPAGTYDYTINSTQYSYKKLNEANSRKN